MQLLSFPGLGGSQPHRGCVHKLGAEPCPRETCWALTHPEGRDGGKTWSSGHRHTPGERPQEEPACPHRLSDSIKAPLSCPRRWCWGTQPEPTARAWFHSTHSPSLAPSLPHRPSPIPESPSGLWFEPVPPAWGLRDAETKPNSESQGRESSCHPSKPGPDRCMQDRARAQSGASCPCGWPGQPCHPTLGVHHPALEDAARPSWTRLPTPCSPAPVRGQVFPSQRKRRPASDPRSDHSQPALRPRGAVLQPGRAQGLLSRTTCQCPALPAPPDPRW